MCCPSCGFDNPEGVKFCHDCGVPVQNRCPRCGADNPLPDKFRGQCGTAPLSSGRREGRTLLLRLQVQHGGE
jgi:hypothetical protein